MPVMRVVKLPGQKPELQRRVADQKPDTLETLEDGSALCPPTVFFSLLRSPSSGVRVQMSPASFKDLPGMCLCLKSEQERAGRTEAGLVKTPRSVYQ